MGVMTWMTEQTLREIYLKPFEIAVKLGEVEEKYLADNGNDNYSVQTITRKAATGMMTSMNYIGAVWTSLDYSLCTRILRGEWGFEGVVITDSVTPEQSQFLNALQTGNDYWLNFMRVSLTDKTSPEAQWAIRNAIHDMCYAVVNSSYIQNSGPSQEVAFRTAPWRIALYTVDAVLAVLAASGVAWIVLRMEDERRNPENYKKGE